MPFYSIEQKNGSRNYRLISVVESEKEAEDFIKERCANQKFFTTNDFRILPWHTNAEKNLFSMNVCVSIRMSSEDQKEYSTLKGIPNTDHDVKEHIEGEIRSLINRAGCYLWKKSVWTEK